jgi:hypothetical protein
MRLRLAAQFASLFSALIFRGGKPAGFSNAGPTPGQRFGNLRDFG